MAFKPTYRGIWGLSYPLIVAAVSETVVEVTDTAFLARYGLTELAAIGLAGALYAVALFPVVGLVDGIQITVGRRAGEERPRALGQAFNQGAGLLLAAALLLIALVVLGLGPATAGLFTLPAVHAAVDDYLTIAILGLPFHALGLALSAFYVAIARTRVLIGATAALAVTNIVLDYGLIFGRLGLPELGMQGAALASVAAEAAAFAWLLADAARRGYLRSHALFRPGRWDGALARRLLTLSAPVSADALVESLRWFAFFVLIERLGEATLARANIVYS
ncbi:MAG TPA: MATE family efflux transporter, partial [Gammaproteobacteria bacterium]|nr:MATE family efflux transporter [Gammaproteobacteria bacterium]